MHKVLDQSGDAWLMLPMWDGKMTALVGASPVWYEFTNVTFRPVTW